MGRLAAALVALLAAPLLGGCAIVADQNDVRFETGWEEFAYGDSITLTEVRGNHIVFDAGGVYRLRGKYTLGSRDEAILAVAVLGGDTIGDSTRVTRGSGTFELAYICTSDGQPYLSFRPVGEESRPFGIVFLGTGDTVRREAPPEWK